MFLLWEEAMDVIHAQNLCAMQGMCCKASYGAASWLG